MTEKIMISFGLNPVQQKMFGSDLLEKLAYKRDSQFGVWLEFKTSDPRLDSARSLLQHYSVNFSERVVKVYSPSELKACELLAVAGRLSAGGGFVHHGTQYDFSEACPTCSAGWRYRGKLFLDTRKMGKKDIATTYDGEVIVSSKLAAILKGRCSGLILRPIYHYTRKDTPSDYYELSAGAVLPRFCRAHSRFYETNRLCAECGRSGYFWSTSGPLELAYHTTELPVSSWSDVNLTWEFFGYYKKAEETEVKLPAVPHPELIVSGRVVELFLAHKIRGVEFFPVFLKDTKCDAQ